MLSIFKPRHYPRSGANWHSGHTYAHTRYGHWPSKLISQHQQKLNLFFSHKREKLQQKPVQYCMNYRITSIFCLMIQHVDPMSKTINPSALLAACIPKSLAVQLPAISQHCATKPCQSQAHILSAENSEQTIISPTQNECSAHGAASRSM